MKTKLLFILSLFLICSFFTFGENFPEKAKTVNDFIPKGWKSIRTANGDLNKDKIEDVAVIIEKNDLNYEYPRSFYRTRGIGTTLVDSEYDRKIKEKNEKYILCSPPIDKVFESLVYQNITCSIAGKIITEYADTSVGLVLGLKYKWTHNE